ncbi:5'-nucleotidase C-terminal domain-containing protein [Brockia lithotrophica]|uniref:2',3'-cyclic-nucleotide 2'-phosphodiesterase (5'-nucleotidase family) n=1 Tax=Brockia lithotrophica TaxID=933949 RepID=A0A660KTT6_9BACL|nr:5'-nucleotidase C-terminal domain-containing protein [Brockia lithotrophica]RKQ84125.1 2',3'-cyclic-nucleotide 2'-phosphodiesterase (5'-nucleotidase family) [Brockia lithotrophica]
MNGRIPRFAAFFALLVYVWTSLAPAAWAQSPAPEEGGLVRLFSEDFGGATKGKYAAGEVRLDSGTWYLDDALLGKDDNPDGTQKDKRVGERSVRIRNSGKLEMRFDVDARGRVRVDVLHAMYGSDQGGRWRLEYSPDKGETWRALGEEVASGPDLALASFSLDLEGFVRFRVLKTDGSTDGKVRINVAEFAVYTGAPGENPPSFGPPGDGQDVPPRDPTAPDEGGASPPSGGNGDHPVKLHLIHTNDIHAKIGDFAKLARYVQDVRAHEPYTLFLDIGDQFSGDAVVDLPKGKPMVELMNAVGLDAMVVGNHDFDYGPEETQARRAESTYPWLAANVHVADPAATPLTPFVPYVVFRWDSAGRVERIVGNPGDHDRDFGRETSRLTVGVLAVTQAPPATAPKNVVGLEFEPYIPAIERYLWLRDRVDVLILATHVGYPDDRLLAEHFGPVFDLIAGAHSHTRLDKPVWVNGVPIVQTGAHLENVGHTVLTVDPGARRVIHVDGELVPLASLTEADPRIQEIVDRATADVRSFLEEVVGTSQRGLSQAGKTRGDTPLGNFWTDAMRFYLRDLDPAPDIAFMNGGGIRGDLAPGPITRGDLYRIEPFANQLTVIDLPGRALEEILRYSYTRDGRNTVDLQVSGMHYTLVTDAQGNLLDVHMEVGGKPVDPDRIYRVVVPDYIGTGGSGYPFPRLGEIRFTMVGLVTQALEEYARHLMDTRGSVDADKEGRIRIEVRVGAEEPDLVSVRAVREAPEGTLVRTRGVVTTPLGAWGGKGFYLQDDTGGIYVYQTNDEDFGPGDEVEVVGRTKVYNGELEIADPVRVTLVRRGAPLPAARVVAPTPEDLAAHQGELVRLEGVRIENLRQANKYGSFEFLAAGASGAGVLVRVDSRTGLDYTRFTEGLGFREGDVLDVVGIASVYNGTYQLKPRGAEDFVRRSAEVPAPPAPPVEESPPKEVPGGDLDAGVLPPPAAPPDQSPPPQEGPRERVAHLLDRLLARFMESFRLIFARLFVPVAPWFSFFAGGK